MESSRESSGLLETHLVRKVKALSSDVFRRRQVKSIASDADRAHT